MEIGALLREKRKQKGLTMKKLADIVEVSEGTISRWESGDIKNIKRSKIEKLSDVLEISPYTIMGWKKDDTVTVNDTVKNIEFLASQMDSTAQARILAYTQAIHDMQYPKNNKEDKS
jgi:transcriptional regulator with XRE-family HTH domain